jgi:hypothetical protein
MNEKRLSPFKFSCLQCDADNLVWPDDLDAIKELSGDETQSEAMDFLRCKICGGEVTISGEDQRALYMSDRSFRHKTLTINRSRYDAIVRVPHKITICCTNVNIVLESDDDEILGELAGNLARALDLISEGAATVEIPDSVAISLA